MRRLMLFVICVLMLEQYLSSTSWPSGSQCLGPPRKLLMRWMESCTVELSAVECGKSTIPSISSQGLALVSRLDA